MWCYYCGDFKGMCFYKDIFIYIFRGRVIIVGVGQWMYKGCHGDTDVVFDLQAPQTPHIC